jgi:LacI family transcriptional regulator/LacI family repressor for deo operon, udp, cdd, tsx, nupC, and nupG
MSADTPEKRTRPRQKATINDVAELAGVSNATVSAVINNKPTVKASTRQRVQRAIKELKYRPRAAAQQRFKSAPEKTIGLVIKEIQNPYFPDIIVGAHEVAAREGYRLLIASSERVYDREQEVVHLLASKDVDGLIINPLLDENADLSHLFDLKQRNIPFVLLERVHGLRAGIVDVDNVEASRQAVTYLIESGHKRILHLAGPSYSMHSAERIQGFRRAFSESHLFVSDADIVVSGATMEAGHQSGLEVFSNCSDRRPTAVTCYNDLVAIGLLRALRECGLSVPEDVSVIGFDDIGIDEYLEIPLTTVRVPKMEMGRQAAEILIRHIVHGEPDIYEKILVPATLVIRASTGSRQYAEID